MTLIELLLVLFIISVMTGLVLPTVVGNFSEVQRQGAMERLMATCRRARCEACGTGRTHRLNVNADAGTYWITVESDPLDAPGVFDRVGESWGRIMELPDRIQFRDVSPLGDETAELHDDDADADAVIEFHPDGRSTGAVITIGYRDPDADEEDVLILHLDAATAEVRVISIEERDAIESVE